MRQTSHFRLRHWTLSGMVAAMALIVSACAYRPPLIQGNAITQEMVARLKPGMNRNAVLDIMGTPLLVSMFHEGRWDYVFRYNNRKWDEASTEYRVTLTFKGDQLERIDNPQTLPTELELNALVAK